MRINPKTFQIHPNKRIGHRSSSIMDHFVTTAPCQNSKHASVRLASINAVAAVEAGEHYNLYTKETDAGEVWVTLFDLK